MAKQGEIIEKTNIGVAVDLGSTSIAVSCLNMLTKDELCSFSFANPQRSYGADVITRIRYCMESKEHLYQLQDMVWDSLYCQLKEHLGEAASRIRTIVFSGNTTMLHIIRGLSVKGLASAPFTPVTLAYAEEENVFDDRKIKAIYPPGFSAFVGADILMGAWYLQMGQQETYDLLVDLGTNGEMLLLNQNKGYATSTACGPVFDSAVTGAAYGSECIKAIAGCVKRHLIDETGLLAAPYFDKGIEIDKGFVIKQNHVRNFQLAKGAIYAGIQCLMEKVGIEASQIGQVFISGGLGFYMEKRDAFTVKMLPKDFSDKIVVSGNSSLEGAKKLLKQGSDEENLREFQYILEGTESFELADMPGFQERYMQSLNF